MPAKKLPKLYRVLPLLIIMSGIFFLSHLHKDDLPDLGQFDLDKVLHAMAYAVLATSAIFAVLPQVVAGRSARIIAAGITLFCLLHGISDEFHQSFIPGRMASSWDILADFTGALAASLFWYKSRWEKFLPTAWRS